jgi:hypothetical protein
VLPRLLLQLWEGSWRVLEGKGGMYLEDCEEAKRGLDDGDGFGIGFVSQSYDSETEDRLWKY